MLLEWLDTYAISTEMLCICITELMGVMRTSKAQISLRIQGNLLTTFSLNCRLSIKRLNMLNIMDIRGLFRNY